MKCNTQAFHCPLSHNNMREQVKHTLKTMIGLYVEGNHKISVRIRSEFCSLTNNRSQVTTEMEANKSSRKMFSYPTLKLGIANSGCTNLMLFIFV